MKMKVTVAQSKFKMESQYGGADLRQSRPLSNWTLVEVQNTNGIQNVDRNLYRNNLHCLIQPVVAAPKCQ